MLVIEHVREKRAHDAAYRRLHARGVLARRPWFWRWLLDRVDAPPGARFLDVACGDGALGAAAAARGWRVASVDRSAAALRRSSATGPARSLLQADGERLPLADGSFDVVANIGSLEHFLDPAAGAAELARVLRPGGLAIVLLPNAYGLRGPVLHAWRRGALVDDGQPIQRYATRQAWQALLERAGLVVEAVLGCESLAEDPARPAAWLGALRHPTRLLALAHDRLPVDLAVELVFVCGRAAVRNPTPVPPSRGVVP